MGRFDPERVIILPVGDDLAARVDDLPDQFRAVVLAQIDPVRAREEAERAAEHGLRLVVSDHDGAAAALCAAVLRHLRIVGRPTEVAKVAIAGGDHLPALAPLLMIAGVCDLLSWQDRYATAFPWTQAIRDADVAVDLRPGMRAAAEAERIAQDRPEGSMLRPADAAWSHHVVAGVLRVALACPPGSMHLDLGVLRACATAMVFAAPRPGHGRINDAAITDAVEAAVRRCIDPRLATSGAPDGSEVI
ncbi:hypothetical protein ACQEVB_38820 [Pseudonocardia sp. CA-107938]|uniref:hypothetical protein n=1 Tax=Pseudonocardia sp. CA-107938 TaxID=3240021 RepID=UPI003D8C032E